MTGLWRILRAGCMALWGHRGQKDKSGKPYWHHLLAVACLAYGLSHESDAVVVALLHDYLEDVDPKATGLILKRFGYVVALSVTNVTRLPKVPYRQFIVQIAVSGTYLAQVVKLADLLHNTQPGRLTLMQKRDKEAQERSVRYHTALDMLIGIRVHRNIGMYR